MKKLLLMVTALLPLIATAQNTSLSGNWREVKRSELNGTNTFFRDTIRMNFLIGNEYTWVKKGGFNYRGTYKIENGRLDMGARTFTIVATGPERLMLRDDETLYEFAPYEEAPVITLQQEPAPRPVNTVSQMTGNWKVYKRTSAKTLKSIDYHTLVESVRIFATPDADGNIGWVAAAKDPDNMHSWKIIRFVNGRLYATGKSNREFDVLKAEEELILREGHITYFFKQFDK